MAIIDYCNPGVLFPYLDNWFESSTYRIGQSFTASDNYTLEAIRVYLKYMSSLRLPGMVTCELYATDGSGLPTGSILSSGFINGSSLSATSRLKVFSMSSYSLVSSTKYAFLIKCENQGSGYGIALSAAAGGGCGNGSALRGDDGSVAEASWWDCYFDILGSGTLSYQDVSGSADMTFTTYGNAQGAGGYVFTPPEAGKTKKILVAVAKSSFYYET